MPNLKDALENLQDIYMSESALATLLDVERVIDNLDVYAFKNWKLGELVEGPIYEKYFVTTTFMWPYKLMPDPRGGEQLLNYNCEVLYKKDKLELPVKVKSEADFKPGTKMAKTRTVPIWLVTITIPKDLINEIQRGSIDVENDKIDMDDLEQAYDEQQDELPSSEMGQDPMAGGAEAGGAPGMAPEEQQPQQGF